MAERPLEYSAEKPPARDRDAVERLVMAVRMPGLPLDTRRIYGRVRYRSGRIGWRKYPREIRHGVTFVERIAGAITTCQVNHKHEITRRVFDA
jgi:hypothetical protein